MLEADACGGVVRGEKEAEEAEVEEMGVRRDGERDWRGTESARGGCWMREMKWQINVNRRRPFITGLHGRGRCVWQRERTEPRGASKPRGCMHVHVHVSCIYMYARECVYIRTYVRGRGHTTIYRIGKTISEK